MKAQRARGALDLAFGVSAGATRVQRFYQDGCLKARLPRGDGLAEVVTLNISGGVAGGDVLETRVEVGAGARVRVASQAAERVYRALDGVAAEVSTHLRVEAGAELHYLPQETIFFDGFALRRRLDVDLADGAGFLGVESLVFGRLASGEVVREGWLRDKISVRVGGRLVFQDMTRLEWDVAARLEGRAVAGGARASALVICAGGRVEAVRAALEGAVAGASVIENFLVARILAPDGAALRLVVVRVLAACGGGELPRVWQG
jgi:urease accessory protein